MPATRIVDFDTWQPGYGGGSITVYLANTTTLATLYADEDLGSTLANPQTLDSLIEDGIDYGKFAAPVYVNAAVEWVYNNTDQSGIVRPPLTTLDAQDASLATVTTADGTRSRTLDERFDDVLHALDYGVLGATAAVNNTTLTAAIGAAAANGGARILLPEGTFPFTGLTLSAGVILEGEGKDVTILQCQTGGNCITNSGDKAGLSRLTLDGVNKVASSVGVFSKANDDMIFEDVIVKRFVTGLHFKGGRRNRFKDFDVDDCTNGVKMHGDNDAGGGANGDEFRHNVWIGGKVSQCSTVGVELSFEDKKCWHNSFIGLGFDTNTGTALKVNGARYSTFVAPWWTGNTTDFAVLDDDDTDNDDINTVIGLRMIGGMISGGAATFNDTCQDITLENMEISDVDFTLTSVDNHILLQSCIEDSSVTITGDGTKLTRRRENDHGASSGLTTDATVTKAWAVTLQPGDLVFIEAKVLGNMRNGISKAAYFLGVSAHRPGSTLAYDGQTANFTVGDVLTGGTSGATARIIADSDSGASGTLTLKDIDGVFENNETITDGTTGSALANGTLSHQNCALLGSVTALRTAYEDVAGWDCTIAANGEEIELRVTGAVSTTIDWTADVETTFG